MKKLYGILLFLGFGLFVEAQNGGGTPVQGLIPINRISTTTNITNSVNATASAAAAVSTPTGNSTEVGITEGQLSVSLTGGATYSIPIAVPPGINGVVPQVGLVYNSQGGNGMAGYGWNISGVSAITRIPRTKFHDGIMGGVNLDANDRFALDGQRLILKSGTPYGAAGTVYETESFSNTKITAIGVSPLGANYGPASFLVEYPDGSKAEYGTSVDSRSITTWSITYWENPQGIRISYNYILVNNNLSIEYIKYGSIGVAAPINQIKFVYKSRLVTEQVYVAGQSVLTNTILSEIQVSSNTVGFRNYVLEHNNNNATVAYEKLTKITEKNGINTLSYNPTVFTYGNTSDSISYANITTSLNVGNINASNAVSVSGDFDGDEKMDFILYPTNGASAKSKYWFFSNLYSGSSTNLGVEHNVGSFETIFPVNWLTWDNKLWANQGWAVAKKTDTDYTFSIYYAQNPVSIFSQYDRVVTFPTQSVSVLNGCVSNTANKIFPKKILSGDFNGDGLTDVIAIDMELISITKSPTSCNPISSTITSKKVYFVDLKRDNTTNFLTYSGELAFPITASSKIEVADVNGDGKSDFMVFENGKVTTYTLNSTNQLTLMWDYPDVNISIDSSKTILLGDYNGDGKTDFMIPKGYGYTEWYKYSSTGNNFVKLVQDNRITFLQNTTSSTNSYIVSDYNKDGKSDLIRTRTYLDTPGTSGRIEVNCYPNINGNFSPDFRYSADSSYSPDIKLDVLPIYLTTGRGIPSNGKPYNPTLDIAFLNNNKVFYFTSDKDNVKDQLLKSITTGNGVKESITYQALSPDSKSDDVYIPQNGSGKSIYTNSLLTENYPNTDLSSATALQVVTKLERQSSTVYKKQLFFYHGATSNMEGLGFLGFRSSMRTNWFENDSQIISSISKYAPNLRGANIENYTYLGIIGPDTISNAPVPNTGIPNSITLSDYIFSTTDVRTATGSIIIKPGQNGTVISPPAGTTNYFLAKILPNYDATGYTETNTSPPSNLISRSLLYYENSLSTTKVYKLQNVQSKNYSILENTSSETNTIYDAFNNPTESITKLKNGGIDEQTTVSTITYETPSTSPYIIGKPLSKNQTVISYGDSKINKETYVYGTGTESNLVKTIQKWGNNTSAITETNVYDAFGNITKKTIAAGLESRVTNYEYNSASPFNGRFLTKSIDVEGLATTFVYNPDKGVLDSETNPYGLTTSYLYDSWFKKTRTTNYLGKYITYEYLRQTEKTKITATGDSDGSYSEELFDDLGRKIQTGIKDIQSNMSYKDFVYDIYDRNYSVSEPHTGTPSLWNTTAYDVYGRPITATASTGKVMTMLYDKLTTTETDSTTGKTKTATKNALGNVITLVETSGGTINYSYFANGNVKETNYAGNKITITQDGWGRKTSLVDPSAGTYTYEYNELGENIKETTPNGTTTYVLDHNTGKPNSKTIVGTNTNSSTVYTYNTLPDNKLLKKTVFTDLGNANKIITIDYTYDTYKRLKTSVETNGYSAEFTKTIDYDAWGRVDIETKTATLNAGSRISTIKTQNEYKNGFAYKIKDYPYTKTLWETSEVNARGQLTKATLGNGIVINNTYNSNGYVTNMKHTLATTTIMEFGTDFDIQRGNLNWRKNSLFGNVQENFGYDTQDRLTTYPNALGVQVTQTYEDDGRIKANTLGTYNYANSAKKYQNTSVTLTPEATGYYANREGVFDDSMEERNGWDNSGIGSSMTYDDLKSHSGKYSLKLNNPGSTEKVIHANKWIPINNTVATQYTYSAWVYSDNPTADLFLFMKTATETGYYTSISSVSTTVKNQWVKIEGTFLVPATIKKLNIRLDNNGLGNVWFDDVKIRKTSNSALANILVPDASYSDHQLNVSYNTFKSPYQIEETGKDKISFTYNDNNNRSVMFYGSLNSDKNLRPNRKHYSADGSMEIKENIFTGEIEFVTYLGGDGYSAPVVYKKNYDAAGVTQDQMLYLHRDYQGSILAITNQVGVIIEKRQFDAWGAIIQVQDGAGNILNGLILLDRGYTGHEHLQSVGLIHMNGRLYDPKLHRFLQPDNYVQDISNTQNYNRYGYVLNNPLKYTDYSGEKWKITWSDVFSALEIIVGTVILLTPGVNVFVGALGVGLIGSGIQHFKSAYNEYKQTGDWSTASNNAGFILGIKMDTDILFGGDKPKIDANGVTQSEPVVKPKSDGGDKNGNDLDPSTIEQNLPLLGGNSTYAGGDNPMTYNKDYTYSYVPTMMTDYPAIGHDRRYDNLGISGLSGLFWDTRAIGADWKFVSEQFQLLILSQDPITKGNAFILGAGLGGLASLKTIYQMTKPFGYSEMIMWYNYSSYGVTNKPGN